MSWSESAPEPTPGKIAYAAFRETQHPQLTYQWELLPAGERQGFETMAAVIALPLLKRIEELEKEVKRLTQCQNCFGTGNVQPERYQTSPCPACKGRGQITR